MATIALDRVAGGCEPLVHVGRGGGDARRRRRGRAHTARIGLVEQSESLERHRIAEVGRGGAGLADRGCAAGTGERDAAIGEELPRLEVAVGGDRRCRRRLLRHAVTVGMLVAHESCERVDGGLDVPVDGYATIAKRAGGPESQNIAWASSARPLASAARAIAWPTSVSIVAKLSFSWL